MYISHMCVTIVYEKFIRFQRILLNRFERGVRRDRLYLKVIGNAVLRLRRFVAYDACIYKYLQMFSFLSETLGLFAYSFSTISLITWKSYQLPNYTSHFNLVCTHFRLTQQYILLPGFSLIHWVSKVQLKTSQNVKQTESLRKQKIKVIL